MSGALLPVFLKKHTS